MRVIKERKGGERGRYAAGWRMDEGDKKARKENEEEG